MRATFFTALAAAAALTLPRALEEPLAGAAWALALALAAGAHLARVAPLARAATPVAGVLWLQVAFLPLPAGHWTFGLVLGLMASLVALGMALVYRANRVLNFAQAELGTVPAVLTVALITFSGLPWLVAVPLGLAAAVVLGIVVEVAVIRRFRRAPRLILTVATIGLSQLLTAAAALLPRLWGEVRVDVQIDVPFTVRLASGPPALTGDHLLAIVGVPVIVAALAVFIRTTDVGVAIRAAAQSADRAALLGIPVRRLQTLVWCLATVLSFCGLLLRAGVLSLPVAAQLSFGALLVALAALVLGRFTDLVAVGAAAVSLGVLEQAVVYNHGQQLVAPVLGAVIVVALLARRAGASRVERDVTATWQASEEVRPVPPELAGRPEVRLARAAGVAAAVVAVVALPFVVPSSVQLEGAFVACFVLVVASVVVLTGWAGQVSLGQMSLAAVGGAVGAVATAEWQLDLSAALLVAAAAGALAAMAIGLPALRLRGPLLAVTTLAFAVASSQYLLNRTQAGWIPTGRIARPRLLAVIDLGEQRAMYWTCVAVAGLGLLAVRRIRTSRTGRVLLAVRDGEAAAQGFGVEVVRAKLSAFALSGALAAVAGCLYVHALYGYSEAPFAPTVSFNVFTAAVVGGLGSLTGAVLGALFLSGGRWVLPGQWQLLPTALGVLVVLLALPGGLGSLAYRGRDAALRRLALRRGIAVPSLVADRRVVEDEPGDVAAVAAAADHVPEEVGRP